ncbi:substrate-binding domain-containing protein [Actinokineospora sp. NPDC004072]
MSTDEHKPERSQLGWVALMMLGEVLMALSANSLTSVRAWAQFVGGAVMVAAGGLQLRAPVLSRLRRWVRSRSRRLWTRLVAWTAGVTAAAAAVWIGAPPAVAYGRFLLYGCAHPVELRVATSTDDVQLYEDVADAYERHTAEAALGCRTTHVAVFGVSPERAVTGLGTGWSADYVRDYGPHPDVLITSSPRDAADVRARLAGTGTTRPRIGDAREIAWTPLVLGVPIGVSGALGTDRNATTWHDLLQAAQRAGVGVVRPYPVTSGVGLLATDALFSAPDGGLLPVARARDRERWAARSADAGGFPLGPVPALLQAHRARERQGTALIVPEQALVQANARARADAQVTLPNCAAADAPPSCLIAHYPADTFRLRHTFVPVEWAADTPAALAARDFGAWLATPAGQAALGDTGLRTTGADAGELLSRHYGALTGPQAGPVRGEPDPARQAAVEALLAAAQRHGRILLAVDASAGMGVLEAGGRTRLTSAAGGVDRALALLGPEDVVGVWAYAGDGARPIVPFGQRDQVAPAVRDRLPGVTAAGPAPLHRAVADGVAAVGPSGPRQASAVVVLAGGPDTAGGMTTAQLLDAVRGRGVRVFVIAMGDATCTSTFAALTATTDGACLHAGPGSVERALTDLFQQLWG